LKKKTLQITTHLDSKIIVFLGNWCSVQNAICATEHH